MPGVLLHLKPANGGYIDSIMAGAALATKEVLILLNNDTIACASSTSSSRWPTSARLSSSRTPGSAVSH